MSVIGASSEAEIWNRAIRPDIGDLSAEAARDLLRLTIADTDRERIRNLSEKAHSGKLSQEESMELEGYLNVGSTLEFLKAKARLSLKEAQDGGHAH